MTPEHEGFTPGPEYAGPSLTNAQYVSLLAENARLREALEEAKEAINVLIDPSQSRDVLVFRKTLAAIDSALSAAGEEG